MSVKIFALVLVTLAGQVFAESKAPIYFVISGGATTCNRGTQFEMQTQLQAFADRIEQSEHPVTFIMTCFTGLLPSEDFKFFAMENHGAPGPVQTIRGGRNFAQNFQNEFIHGYLNQVIPPGAHVFTAGQSHGGDVALSIAASRPVDFMATLDPISRTDCNLRELLSLRALRKLKDGVCNQPTSPDLLRAVDDSFATSHGIAMNIFQTASILHSGLLASQYVSNLDYGTVDPRYQGFPGKRQLSIAPHMALATDPKVWSRILVQMQKKMAEIDPDWPARSDFRSYDDGISPRRRNSARDHESF